MKKTLGMTMLVCLLVTGLGYCEMAKASTKLSVSSTNVVLIKGKSKLIKANKTVTWSSSNKKIAKVKKISNKKAKITAVTKGTCKIYAKKGNTKVVVKVTVKNSSSNNNTTISPTPAASTKPQDAETSQPLHTLTPEERQELEDAIPENMPTVTLVPTPVVTSNSAVSAEPQDAEHSQPLHTLTPEEQQELEDAIPENMPTQI